jgi:hypothetical protein
MLKLQLITVIDFKYKIKIKFFFTEGLFLSSSYTCIYMISIILPPPPPVKLVLPYLAVLTT